jgi:uncharacterized protein with PQ loop repeat
MSRFIPDIHTLAYIVTVLSLAFTSDQVRLIWIEHSASGVSLISWIFYTIAAFVWLLYGISRRDKVIIVANALWVVLCIVIVVGVLLFR